LKHNKLIPGVLAASVSPAPTPHLGLGLVQLKIVVTQWSPIGAQLNKSNLNLKLGMGEGGGRAGQTLPYER